MESERSEESGRYHESKKLVKITAGGTTASDGAQRQVEAGTARTAPIPAGRATSAPGNVTHRTLDYSSPF